MGAVRHCSKCLSGSHYTRNCPLLIRRKTCKLCAGLSHRVKGERCAGVNCGLAFREAAPVKLDVDSRRPFMFGRIEA